MTAEEDAFWTKATRWRRKRKRSIIYDDAMTSASSTSAKMSEAAENGHRCKGADLVVDGILAASSLRTLTSSTYARRLQLSRSDAAGLFPEARETMDHVFAQT